MKFGVCLIDDILEPEYSFLPSKGPINGWKRKRCFCFTTPYPYFDLYADVLQTIVALESDYQKEKSRPLHTLDVLKLFNEIQPPRLGQNIEFHEKGIDINFTRQAGPKELFHYISHFGIGVLFSTLGVYQILHILCAIFMEQKVVFASDNLRILSGVVLAFSTFLEPFSLYAPVIPVLPLSMLDTLDAPLPYIIGIPSTRAIYETVKFFPSVVVVDLDQKKGYRGTAPLPKIPRQDKMCAELEALAKSLHEENRGDIYQTNPAIARLREVIYKKITGYVYSLFGDFKLHCICNITDCLVNFFPETFLSGIPAEDTPFYKQFFKTKLFNKYQEDEIKRIKAEITQANYKNNARNQGTRRTAPALPTFLESSAPATSTPTKTPLSPFLSHGGRGQVHRSHSQLSLSSEAAAPSPAPSHLSKPATPSDFLSRSLSLNNIEEYEDLDKVLLRGVEEQTDEGSSDDDSDNEKPDTKDPSNFDDIVL
uniref:UDENN domain-containing protein n=1 Tax=Arcella intermedia TaxID=1963864 RepID=A0A6B2L2I5_9EUKA